MTSYEVKPTLTSEQHDVLAKFHNEFNAALNSAWDGPRKECQMHVSQYHIAVSLSKLMQTSDLAFAAQASAQNIVGSAKHANCASLAYGAMKPSNGFLRSEVITLGDCESKLIAAYSIGEDEVLVQLIVGFGE